MATKAKRREEEAPEEEPGPTDDEKSVISGFPEDGEAYSEEAPEPEAEDDEEDEAPEPQPTQAQKDYDSEIERMRAEIRALEQKLKPAPEPQAEDEPNWDTLLFESPSAAVDAIERRVEKKLRAQYTQEKQQETFWRGFYDKHSDLKGDMDLVSTVLNSHVAELQDMPVDKAADRLADLTRERILRYQGSKPKGKKVTVEGEGGPKRKAPPKEEPKVTTLSDLIRARKAKRRGTAA